MSQADARVTCAPTMSRRTTGHLRSQPGRGSGMDAARRRGPIPPVHQCAGLEVGPEIRVTLNEHPAVARDLETEQRRRVIERDQIDRPARGPRQRDFKRAQRVQIKSQHADIEIARGGRVALRRRSEEHAQPYAAIGLERFDEFWKERRARPRSYTPVQIQRTAHVAIAGEREPRDERIERVERALHVP